MVPGDPQPWQVTRGWEATCWRVAGAVGLPESALSGDRELGDLPAKGERGHRPPGALGLTHPHRRGARCYLRSANAT